MSALSTSELFFNQKWIILKNQTKTKKPIKKKTKTKKSIKKKLAFFKLSFYCGKLSIYTNMD